MKSSLSFGEIIRNKRLALNMPMSELARRSNISRATLSSIENGNNNYSVKTLLNIFEILNINLNIEFEDKKTKRSRAQRINTVHDKKVNRFIVMCVEHYASYSNKTSEEAYKELSKKGIIQELDSDYEDLHGMSTMYLNEYISTLVGGA